MTNPEANGHADLAQQRGCKQRHDHTAALTGRKASEVCDKSSEQVRLMFVEQSSGCEIAKMFVDTQRICTPDPHSRGARGDALFAPDLRTSENMDVSCRHLCVHT